MPGSKEGQPITLELLYTELTNNRKLIQDNRKLIERCDRTVNEHTQHITDLTKAIAQNTIHINELKNGMELLKRDIEHLPRFDWKWFTGIVASIVFALVVMSVNFHGTLKTHGVSIAHIQSDITRVEKNLQSNIIRVEKNFQETNQRIDSLETKIQDIDVRLARLEGGIDLINQKLDTLLKTSPE